MKKTLPKPEGGKNLKWVLDNPDAVREVIHFLELLAAAQIQVVPGNTANGGKNPAIVSDSNVILPIPVAFPYRVEKASAFSTTYTATVSGGTYNATVQSNINSMSTQVAALTTQVINLTTQLNAAIQALKLANINPL